MGAAAADGSSEVYSYVVDGAYYSSEVAEAYYDEAADADVGESSHGPDCVIGVIDAEGSAEVVCAFVSSSVSPASVYW